MMPSSRRYFEKQPLVRGSQGVTSCQSKRIWINTWLYRIRQLVDIWDVVFGAVALSEYWEKQEIHFIMWPVINSIATVLLTIVASAISAQTSADKARAEAQGLTFRRNPDTTRIQLTLWIRYLALIALTGFGWYIFGYAEVNHGKHYITRLYSYGKGAYLQDLLRMFLEFQVALGALSAVLFSIDRGFMHRVM